MQQVEGRVALVTGATSGIGAAIARHLAAQGAHVVINGRDQARGRSVLETFEQPDRVRFVGGDVAVREQCEDMVDRAIAWHGRVDILVNNAGGTGGTGLVHELTDEDMWDGWRLNLMSAFWACRRVLPGMIERLHGRIINISSSAGKIAVPAISPYVTTKHALHGLTKSIAVENATHGITSNAICPGPVDTPMVRESGIRAAAARGMTYEDFVRTMSDRTLVKRMLTVDEIAVMAVLLASDSASAITGQCISVDGGSVIAG